LAGQYSQYIVSELQMWTRGFCKSPEVTALIARRPADGGSGRVLSRGSRRHRMPPRLNNR
jgi:hypothetical protein